MAYKIRKSKEFLNNVLTILAYIEKEWGIKSSEKFQTILDSKIDSLSIHPKIGRAITRNKHIRKLMITKHNKIYYKIRHNEIIILTLFESKQNPNRNKYE
jgi:plasmid stabilization system protein ParE